MLANKPFIMNVYHSVSREQVENYLYQLTYDLLEGVVEEQAAGMSVRPEDKAFIANVYKYAFVGLMLDWIKHDMKGRAEADHRPARPCHPRQRYRRAGALPPRRPIRSTRLIKNYTISRPVIRTLSPGIFCLWRFFGTCSMLIPSKGKHKTSFPDFLWRY